MNDQNQSFHRFAGRLMPKAFFGIFVMALLACGPAMAAEGPLMKGKTLALLCNSSKQDDRFSCQSYIAGIIDYHTLIKSLRTAPAVDFCIPAGTPMAQMTGVVTRYIAAHSEHQDFIAAPGVAMALYNAYPCKKKGR